MPEVSSYFLKLNNIITFHINKSLLSKKELNKS